MTTDRLRHQHELHLLFTYFYRGHNRSVWTSNVHPQPATSHSNQQLHQYLLARWHFIGKPPRLKDRQRQPLEWWTSLNGRRSGRRQINNGIQRRCIMLLVDCDGCGGSVSQQLTCEWLRLQWRPKEEPLFGGDFSVNGRRLRFDWWHGGQTAMTLTCFVVGRSLFFVQLDLKWFSLSVVFHRMAASGQRTVDMFAFRVAKWQKHQLQWRCDEHNPDDISVGRFKGKVRK